jgi:nucleotide-binding universal stress UspA family protein
MRRVLTLLDGSDLTASILPDAQRLAGPGGEIFLIRDVSNQGRIDECETRMARAEAGLRRLATVLSEDGTTVRTHVSFHGEPIAAVTDAIRTFDPDAVAAVTHARSGLDRMFHGSVSWWLLEHCPVPVLLRHVDEPPVPESAEGAELRRNILVPLDGSALAESALPLACSLAQEWDAILYLVRVMPDELAPRRMSPKEQLSSLTLPQPSLMRSAREYLDAIALLCPVTVHRAALYGKPVDVIEELAKLWWITDIVLASHGRTGIDRVTFGSVTEDLIKRSHLPIIVVPSPQTAHRMSRPLTETGALGYTRR